LAPTTGLHIGRVGQKLTGRLLAEALVDGSRVLEVDVPGFRLAGRVLERETEDGLAGLDGVLALLLGGQGGGDGVECARGRELVCSKIECQLPCIPKIIQSNMNCRSFA
jgi:hypothetical protein